MRGERGDLQYTKVPVATVDLHEGGFLNPQFKL